MPTLDQFQGCLLGLALGDALGAPHEGGFVERFVWRLLGKTRAGEMRWTDDTQMTIDLIESLLAQGRLDQADLAMRFAASYRWSRGYGPGAAKLLKKIARGSDWRAVNCSIYPTGSYGNGAAMRVPLLGLVYQSRSELRAVVSSTAEITHAHPLGIEGAILVATVTQAVASGQALVEILKQAKDCCVLEPFTSRLSIASDWLNAKEQVSSNEVVCKLGKGIAAHESCVTAVYLALRFLHLEFGQLIHYVKNCRGDVDTIAAMAGAIWGAARGIAELPKPELAMLEQREYLLTLATKLYGIFANQVNR